MFPMEIIKNCDLGFIGFEHIDTFLHIACNRCRGTDASVQLQYEDSVESACGINVFVCDDCMTDDEFYSVYEACR